jgi:hypothetical protein
VPPSPPNATNLTFLSAGILPARFRPLNAASTPEIVAAEFSNALWMNGTFHDEYG